MSQELKVFWLKLLEPYSLEHLTAAAIRMANEYEYRGIPPFAVFRRYLDDVTGQGKESIEAQAAAEWTKLLAEIPAVGAYGKPDLHPTTAYVIRSFGDWEKVCGWKVEHYGLIRKDFVARWKEAHGNVQNMHLGADAIAAINAGISRKTYADKAGAIAQGIVKAIKSGERLVPTNNK